MLPTHHLRGMIRPLELAGILPHHRFPKCLRARRVKYPEPRSNRHLVGTPFPLHSPLLLHWPTHQESPRRDPAQTLDDVLDLERTPGTMQAILSPCRRPGRGNAALERVSPY